MSMPSFRSLPPSTPVWRDEIVGLPGCPQLTMRLYSCGGHACDALPLVLHFHAGAFVRGSLAEGEVIAGVLASAGAVVASMDYPLAPDHPFPQAAEAGHAMLLWAERKRRRLGAKSKQIYVAGEEAGGNLAAAVSMMARDRGGPELAGAILLSPMLDVCLATASHRNARTGPVGCLWADGWRAYLPRAEDAIHPYAAPGASLRLAGLPPTLLISADDDPLRDETRAFAKRLHAAGVPVQVEMLTAPTGWPSSYLEPGPAPWAAPLQARLERFIHPPNLYPGSAL